MSDQTPVTDEVTPPSASADQPSSESTETVESLKEKLAAEKAEKEKALEEAKRWKGRVKEENPPAKDRKIDQDEAYADWRIDNKERISVVKDEYEKELSELQEGGAKLTVAMREKALRLAEKTIGVQKVDPEPIPSGTVDRGGQREPTLTKFDTQFGVKPETKKKYAHLVEG